MTALVTPVTLTGQRWVSLEPLTRDHIAEIDVAAADGELATLWYTMTPKPGGACAWVERMLELRAADHGVSFVVRSLTAGWSGPPATCTWTAPTAGWRSATPGMGHAFDQLNCVAVEFRTHFFNFASRTAIERLGAKLDGVLRSHQIAADGTRRDTVVYSILDIEWPAVRTHLNARLAAH